MASAIRLAIAGAMSVLPMFGGLVTIDGTGAIFAAGALNSTYNGSIMAQSQGSNQVGDGAFSFNPALGTLLSTLVTITNSSFTYTPTYVITSVTPKGGAILTFGATGIYNTSATFGLPDIVAPIVPETIVTCPYSTCGPANSGPALGVGRGGGGGGSTTGSSGLLNGGSIDFKIQTPVTPAAGTWTGDWTFTGNAEVRLTYQPKSPQEYLQYAIAHTAAEQSPADFANLAAGLLGGLRSWDAATSSQNLNLRDAEYWLLGYVGGEANRFELGTTPVDKVYNIVLAGGPLSILGWKSLPSSSGKLPGTGVGGFGPNFDGLIAGYNNTDIAAAIANYGNNVLLSPGSGIDVNHPVLPFKDIPGSSPNGIFDNFLFDFQAPGAGTPVYIDPPGAELFTYAIAGNEITGLTLPQDSGPFILSFSGGTFDLNSGDSFNFLTFAPGGVDNFTLAWNGTSAPSSNQRPVVDLQFLNAGQTLLDITSSQAPSSGTPEPASAALFVAGLVILTSLARSRL
jgi:hypothetical protein